MHKLLALTAVAGLLHCANYSLREHLENPGGFTQREDATAKQYLFFTPGLTQGDLKAFTSAPTARQGADGMCAIARGSKVFPDNRCNTVRGVVSLDGTDTMAAMPANFGIPAHKKIFGPNGLVIAENWSQLMNGTLNRNLFEAGVAASAAESFWSFANADGSVHTMSCSNGNDNSSSFFGQYGAADDVATTWKSKNNVACNNNRFVLCICY